MTSNIVYDGVQRADTEDGSANTLFAGQRLWFAHSVPQRKWLIENAENNGAVIVAMDKDADVRLVDHAKKNNAPGTHSYKYVENSIRKAVLENLADHVVGPATRVSRPVGSTTTAPRHGRTPFTNEDDQQLWDWVQPYVDQGLAWKGNEIYKQLESVNPRHTFQSWRDRYIKHTRFQNRTITPLAEEAQPLPGSSKSPTGRSVQQRKRPRQDLEGVEADEPPLRDNARPTNTRVDRPVGRSNQSPSRSRDPLEHLPSKIIREMRRENPTPQKERIKMRSSLARSPTKRQRTEDLEIPHGSDRFETVPVLETSPEIEYEASRKPFTVEEGKQLYHLVPKLTNVTSGDFAQAWAALASSEDWTGHTPQEWKAYFESVAVPEYCRRNNLSITEVAPYLAQEHLLPSANAPKRGPLRNTGTVDRPINSSMKECDFCHEIKSTGWHLDHKGNRVCAKCAIFLRVAGVPRPSTSALQVIDDPEDDDPPSRQTDTRTPQISVPQRSIAVPVSNYVHRGTSPITSNEDPDFSERGDSGLAEAKSPAFRPDSPTLARVPTPNEARKRRAGRGSQSQSTSQESTQTDSQNLATGFSAQPESTEPLNASLKSLQQSKSSTDSHTTRRSDPTPQFSFPTKSKGDKRRIRDEPGNLDLPTQSSTKSDRHLFQQPANFNSRDDESISPQLCEASLRKDSQGTLQSEPFLLGDEDLDETAAQSAGQLASQSLNLNEGPHDLQTSPISVHLLSDNGSRKDLSNVSSSLEPSDRSTASDDGNPQTRTRFDRFETAPETIDEFDSAVEEQPPGATSKLTKGKERRTSTQALFLDVDEGLDESYLDFELPEPEGGWEKALGYNPDQFGDDELHAQDSHDSEISQTKRKGKGKAKVKDEPQHDSMVADLHLPSPPSQRRPKSQSASPQESGGPQTSRWFASQEALHTGVHRLTLKSILFKALEAATFDFDLASEVVVIILNQLPQKYKRRDKFIPGMEIIIPQSLPGVWTAEDDNLLFSHNSNDMNALIQKHGTHACDARLIFLDQLLDS